MLLIYTCMYKTVTAHMVVIQLSNEDDVIMHCVLCCVPSGCQVTVMLVCMDLTVFPHKWERKDKTIVFFKDFLLDM